MSHSDKKGTSVRKGSKKAEAKELDARIAEVEPAPKQAVDHHAEFQKLSKRAAQLEDQVGDLEEQVRKAREDHRNAQARADDLERRTQEESATTRKHFDDLHETLKRIRSERDQAVDKAEKQERGATGMSEAVAALRKRLEESRAENKELRDKLISTEGVADDLDQRAQGLTGETAELRRQLEDALADGRKAQEARTAAEARATDLGHRLNEETNALRKQLEARTLELAGETAALRKLIDDSAAELKSALETRDRSEKEIAVLRREAAEMKQQAALAEEKAAEANRYFASLERELLDAREAASKPAVPAAAPAAAPPPPPPEPPKPEPRSNSLDSIFDPEPAAPPAPPQVEEKPPPPPAPAPSVFDPEPAPAAPIAASIPPSQPVPAPASSPETTLRPQHNFGPPGPDGQPGFVLHELLPPDAMGVVYRASERATGRVFAVRFLAGQAGDEQTKVIEREVEKLIALPHPNILHVQGSGRRKSRLYLAMDLVQFPTLARAKIHDLRRVLAILCDAAGAVHYAHEEGIHHGDLHPENIVVARDGEQDHPLVKDFELGFLMETLLAPPSPKDGRNFVRNIAYLPPEQVNEAKPKLTVAGDVYGLGATLYAALGGRAPFEGKDAAQVRTRVMFEEPPPLVKLRADVPEPVATIVRRAMVKESGLRYATAKDFHDALAKLLVP